MRRIAALLLILSLLAGLLIPVQAADAVIEDVGPDAWYLPAVRQAFEQGLLDLTSSTTFSPDQTLTRREFIAGLGRAMEIDPTAYSGDTGFQDVPAEDALAPYVIWAKSAGITSGFSGQKFLPDAEMTQEQMVLMLARLLMGDSAVPAPDSISVAYTALTSQTLSAAAKLSLLRKYNVLPDDGESTEMATRAQAAKLLVWLSKLIWGADTPVVNQWMTIEDLAASEDDPILTEDALLSAAEYYGLALDSTAFQALCSINSEYAGEIGAADSQVLVFLFEGAGAVPDTTYHMNALCAVVWKGQVIYLNQYSTTIPDDPFSPRKNEGMAMPTLRSGVYRCTSVNHNGYYAALNVQGAQVVRFTDRQNFYLSTSSGINIHRRNQNALAPASANWGNSVGCCLIGVEGAEAGGQYATFLESVGLVPYGSSGDVPYSYKVSCTLVVDRSFGRDYLRQVGYPDAALDMIG